MNNIENLRRIYGGELPASGPETRVMLQNAVVSIQRLCDELEETRAEVTKLRSRWDGRTSLTDSRQSVQNEERR